jgi:NAD(P)-dependent dehydrogenase (short-subunit alcohol dehydrogenase family)
VVAVDIVEAPLQTLVAELREQGAKITGCTANVASESDVEAMLTTATSTFGRLDILCNNAGIASKDASFINGAILPVDGGWFAA